MNKPLLSDTRRRTVSERKADETPPPAAALVSSLAENGKGPLPSKALDAVVAIFSAERTYVHLLHTMVDILRTVLTPLGSMPEGDQVLARFDALAQANTSLFRKLVGDPNTPLSVVRMCTAFLGSLPRLYSYADFARHRDVMARFLATELNPKQTTLLTQLLDAKGIMLETLFSKPVAHFLLYSRLVAQIAALPSLSHPDQEAVNELLSRLKDLKDIIQEQVAISRAYSRVADELDAIEPVPELHGVLQLGAKVMGAGECVVYELPMDIVLAGKHTTLAPDSKSYPARFCMLNEMLLILRRKKKGRGDRIYLVQLRISGATMALNSNLDHEVDGIRVHDHKVHVELVFEDPEKKAAFISAAQNVKIAYAKRHAASSASSTSSASSSSKTTSSPNTRASIAPIPIPILPPTLPLPTRPLDAASQTKLMISIPPVDVPTCSSVPMLAKYIRALDDRIEALSLGNTVQIIEPKYARPPPISHYEPILDAYAARSILESNARLDALLVDVAGPRDPMPVRDSMMVTQTIDWRDLANSSSSSSAASSSPPTPYAQSAVNTTSPAPPQRPSHASKPDASSAPPPTPPPSRGKQKQRRPPQSSTTAAATTTTTTTTTPSSPSFNARFDFSTADPPVTSVVHYTDDGDPICINPRLLSHSDLLSAYLVAVNQLHQLQQRP